MKKKVLVVSLSMLFVVLAVCGYIVYAYFTPTWDSTGVGYPTSSPLNLPASDATKPYTPADKYVQMLSTPMPVGKHNLPIPDKYTAQAREMFLENKAIFDEIQTFVAPTKIKIDFVVKGNDTIATYHGSATTIDGESIEYSRDVVFKDIVVDFVSGYGEIPKK